MVRDILAFVSDAITISKTSSIPGGPLHTDASTSSSSIVDQTDVTFAKPFIASPEIIGALEEVFAKETPPRLTPITQLGVCLVEGTDEHAVAQYVIDFLQRHYEGNEEALPLPANITVSNLTKNNFSELISDFSPFKACVLVYSLLVHSS